MSISGPIQEIQTGLTMFNEKAVNQTTEIIILSFDTIEDNQIASVEDR